MDLKEKRRVFRASFRDAGSSHAETEKGRWSKHTADRVTTVLTLRDPSTSQPKLLSPPGGSEGSPTHPLASHFSLYINKKKFSAAAKFQPDATPQNTARTQSSLQQN